MIDSDTLEQCKQDQKILQLKISNLEYAIKQSEEIISESKVEESTLIYLKRKVAQSRQDLEVLYFLKYENSKNE